MSKNRHGLSRHIPAEVALEVRRRSKFGCVNCRCGIYQYEHIDPEYCDAIEHDPDHICLLCGGCHDRVTRGRLSKESVRAKYEAVQLGEEVRRPFEEFDLATTNVGVGMGSAFFDHAHSLIRINGDDILSITPPKDGSAFPTISGVFFDRKGRESFRITENEWEGPVDAWDIEVVGRNITVKSGEGEIALSLAVYPPNEIRITKLDMYKDNCHIMCDEQQIMIGQIHGRRSMYFGLNGFKCRGATVGVQVNSTDDPPVFRGIKGVGGEGIFLNDTGIAVGIGSPQMYYKEMKVWQV